MKPKSKLTNRRENKISDSKPRLDLMISKPALSMVMVDKYILSSDATAIFQPAYLSRLEILLTARPVPTDFRE